MQLPHYSLYIQYFLLCNLDDKNIIPLLKDEIKSLEQVVMKKLRRKLGENKFNKYQLF